MAKSEQRNEWRSPTMWRAVGRAWLAVSSASLVALCVFIGAANALAQDEELQDIQNQAEAPAAAPVQADPAPAAGGDADDSEAPRSRNLLSWLYEALTWKYTLVFLAISFTFVALIVMNLLAVRRDRVVPDALVAAFEAHLNEKRYQEAYELARTDESFLGRVLSAGLAKLQSGYAESIEAMQEVGEEEAMRLEQRIGYVALIGTISPMFGLLGTVDGMVQSFSEIAERTTAPPPRDLAHGIEMALVTTLVGLWLAIPAIAVYHILKNRVARLVLEAGIVSEGLMSRFKSSSTGK